MIVEIYNIYDSRVAPYMSLTHHELQLSGEDGVFIAESPKVIKVALEEGYTPLSLLCERKHIEGDAAEIIASVPGLTVFTGSREVLADLTGYKLTRGVLCAFKRKPTTDIDEICRHAKKIAVIENVCDTTNIGSIFRSAVALGTDAILLTPESCDPLNRRAVRVSMGAVFKIPWAFCSDPVDILNNYGFSTIALALHKDAMPIESKEFDGIEKYAVVLGTEGDGLSDKIISKCLYKMIIPMWRNVDSLNVGAAAAIAFWRLNRQK